MMFTCDYKWLSVGVRFVYDVHIWFKPQTTYGICLWWSHVILNELQFYDVHIWCSHMIWLYMMFVYDLPYMMHICDLPLITYDDHMWFKVVFMLKCSHMMFTYDLHVYDVGIWCSHMMLGYDVHIWTCLKIIYGFPLRWCRGGTAGAQPGERVYGDSRKSKTISITSNNTNNSYT